MPAEIPFEIQQLLKLQRLDGRLELLRRELELRPKAHSEKKDRLAALEGKRGEIHEMKQEIQRRIDRVELEGRALDDRIADNQNRLSNASTNTEYQGFMAQIAALETERGEVDTLLLEQWEEMEQALGLEKECEKAIADQRSVVEEEQGDLEKELASIREEAKGILAEREAAREPIEAGLLEEYDSLYARYRERSVVSVVEGICGGCHMSLSPQTMANLKGTQPVHCNNCRRLLYPA